MKKNELAVIKNNGLENPGDNLSARITDTGRQVLKVERKNGGEKYSATRYPSTGTIVETKTTKAD
jgi:hypothetical protein